jgi:hypothetical protein
VVALLAVGAGAWFVASGGDDGGAESETTLAGETTPTTSPQTSPQTSAPNTTSTPTTAVQSVPTLPEGERIVGITPIGSAEIPGGTTVEGHLVGGLTGLTVDPSTGSLLALSDARIGATEAVMFQLDIDLADGRLVEGDVTVPAVTELRDSDGRAYGEAVDLEGLVATSPDTVLVVSEGSSTDDRIEQPVAAPAIHEFDRNGEFVREWPVPDWYLPDPAGESGIRPEGGLQSITATSGDSPQILTAVEYSLYQDETSPEYAGEKTARILAYDADTMEPVAEYRYPLDPTSFDSDEVFGTPFPSGLLDLLAVGEGNPFIAIERSLIEEPHTWRLFEVTLDPSSAAVPTDEGPSTPVTKRLLQTIETRANFESVAFGPELPDGRRSLILVDDNLFAADDGDPRRTVVLAYALETDP